MSSSEEKSTSPVLPKDSDRGSSVSSDLQDEYEELLRYAVVTPKFEPSVLRQSEPAAEVTVGGKGLVSEKHWKEGAGTRQRRFGRAPDFTSSTVTTRIEVSAPMKDPCQADMERLNPIHSEETSSQGSSSCPGEIHDSLVRELTVPDERVTQIESILDLWSGSLKTNVLTELRKWQLHFLEHHNLEIRQERDKHAAHVCQLTNQMENLKELLHTYEISIGRKDEVIANLTNALEKQKERIELMRRFSNWRLQQVETRQDSKQEVYVNQMADRQFELGLLKKVWSAWRSLSDTKWKEKVAKACQTRAESLCVELSNDYEDKITELNTALENAKTEVQRMQSQRNDYEDAMKKAFMRGVCALNLEAMTIFQAKDGKIDQDPAQKKEDPCKEDPCTSAPARFPSCQFDPPAPPPPTAATAREEEMFSCHVAGHVSTSQIRLDSSSTVMVTSGAVGSGIPSSQKLPLARVLTSSQQKAGRTITARIMGRPDLGAKNRVCSTLAVLGVAPPMSSVVVEKHHPVTQQTISQATAAKYSRSVHHASNATSVRPAGHGGRAPHSQYHSNIQSIKVVD